MKAQSPAWLKDGPIVGLENPLESLKGIALPSALRCLEVAIPGAAARIAQHYFTTPPRFDAPAVEKEILASGHRFSVPFRGGKLAAWSWGDGPTVFLLHGWAGRGGQLAPFVRPLVAAGFSVVLFDGPAHGESGGRHASLLHFRDALVTVINRHGPAHAIIGHSMGAAATALALQLGLKAERVVLIGSPVSPEEYAEQFAEKMGITEQTRLRMQSRLEHHFKFRWDDLSIAKIARRMTAPALIVHDRQDRDAPWEDGAEIARCWPRAQLLSTEGLGHRKILRAPVVVGKIVDFIAASPVKLSESS